MWSIAVGLLIVTLSGCAAKSVERDFSFRDDQMNEGLVFFSVSHDQSGGRGAKAIFYIEGGASGESTMVTSLREAFPIVLGSEFKDSYGQLIALALPVGKHRIGGWQITNGTGLRIYPREKPVPLEFSVHAGQARYLGNLHANLQTGRNVFGITIVGNGYPEVRDRRDRDVPMFEARYPQFRGKVVIEPLALGPWTAGSGTRTQVDNPPPVQPLPVR